MFFTSSIGHRHQSKSRHTSRITCAEHVASCAIIQIHEKRYFHITDHVLFAYSPTACGLNRDDFHLSTRCTANCDNLVYCYSSFFFLMDQFSVKWTYGIAFDLYKPDTIPSFVGIKLMYQHNYWLYCNRSVEQCPDPT